MRRWIVLLLLLALWGAPCVAAAGEVQGDEEASAPLVSPPLDEDEEPGLVDVTHERVSRAVLASARWIDSFFGDERAVREETETRFRLGVSNFSEEGDLLRTDLRTSLRLDLPLVGERLRLFVSGDEDEDERVLFSPDGRAREPIFQTRERSAAVGIRYFFLSTLRQNVSLSTGLRFRGGTPVLLVEPRYRHTLPLDSWDMRFTQRFRGYSDGRSEIRTSLDFERPLYERFFFRKTVEGAWFDDEEGYFYGLHAVLYQPLSLTQILQYGVTNGFATRPNHVLEESRLFVSYRQRVWRDWLFFEISPQLAFPRERNYDASPGLLLRLDMIFGDFKSQGILF